MSDYKIGIQDFDLPTLYNVKLLNLKTKPLKPLFEEFL